MMVSNESDIERSRPVQMKVACVFRLGDRRGEATETREGGFRIIIAETKGACVITIIWLNQKVGSEQDGPKR
jgi:hypothetical protein